MKLWIPGLRAPVSQPEFATDQSIYYHSENRFDAIPSSLTFPHQTGYEGPALAVADVNGDGRRILTGGIRASQCTLSAGQHFEVSSVQASGILVNKLAEETAAIFFDADGDGDQDLYIGCGGGMICRGRILFEDLLFLNDGTGMFTQAEMPEIKVPTSSGGADRLRQRWRYRSVHRRQQHARFLSECIRLLSAAEQWRKVFG